MLVQILNKGSAYIDNNFILPCFAVCCKRLPVIVDKEDGKVTLALLPGSSNQVPYKIIKSSPFFFSLNTVPWEGRYDVLVK